MVMGTDIAHQPLLESAPRPTGMLIVIKLYLWAQVKDISVMNKKNYLILMVQLLNYLQTK